MTTEDLWTVLWLVCTAAGLFLCLLLLLSA